MISIFRKASAQDLAKGHLAKKHLASGLLCSTLALMSAVAVHAEDTISDALTASKPIFESSLRSENVDQADFAKDASALTWRNRIGFQSGDFHNVKLLVEFENVSALSSRYNSTLNGKTTYPTVLDPEVTELNRAQLVWTPNGTTTVTAGRQRIILDDARFVGNVGWRQDEQTMDGLRLDTTLGRVKLTGAYLSRINRVVADAKDFNSDSYLINASYSVNEALKFTAFDYALRFTTAATTPTATDIANAKLSSVNTSGLRAYGGLWVSSFKLGYVAQYATQKDYGSNPNSFKLSSTTLEANATYDIFTAKINYESLGGNGKIGFITPLGTVHAFEGFSDVFAATGGNKTSVNGINDLNYSLIVAGHTKAWMPYILNPTLTIIYHDLKTDRLNLDIGTEWDAVIAAGITKNLSVLLKYADFAKSSHPDSVSQPASRTKTWIMLQYKL